MNELNDLRGLLVPLAVGAAGIAGGFFWGRIKANTKATENTWDDALISKVEQIVAERVKEDRPDREAGDTADGANTWRQRPAPKSLTAAMLKAAKEAATKDGTFNE